MYLEPREHVWVSENVLFLSNESKNWSNCGYFCIYCMLQCSRLIKFCVTIFYILFRGRNGMFWHPKHRDGYGYRLACSAGNQIGPIRWSLDQELAKITHDQTLLGNGIRKYIWNGQSNIVTCMSNHRVAKQLFKWKQNGRNLEEPRGRVGWIVSRTICREHHGFQDTAWQVADSECHATRSH